MPWCKCCNTQLEGNVWNTLLGGEEDLCDTCILASDPVMSTEEWEEDFLVYIGDCEDLEGL